MGVNERKIIQAMMPLTGDETILQEKIDRIFKTLEAKGYKEYAPPSLFRWHYRHPVTGKRVSFNWHTFQTEVFTGNK